MNSNFDCICDSSADNWILTSRFSIVFLLHISASTLYYQTGNWNGKKIVKWQKSFPNNLAAFLQTPVYWCHEHIVYVYKWTNLFKNVYILIYPLKMDFLSNQMLKFGIEKGLALIASKTVKVDRNLILCMFDWFLPLP